MSFQPIDINPPITWTLVKGLEGPSLTPTPPIFVHESSPPRVARNSPPSRKSRTPPQFFTTELGNCFWRRGASIGQFPSLEVHYPNSLVFCCFMSFTIDVFSYHVIKGGIYGEYAFPYQLQTPTLYDR